MVIIMEDRCDYEQLNRDFLDTLPLRKPEKGENVRDYREWVEETFKDVDIPDQLHGDMFDWLDDYDFGLYLEKRFGMFCAEEIRIYML